jgi:hypothetical protein
MVNIHPSAAQLLAAMKAYCARTGTSKTAFGLQATGDGYLISRIEKGRTPTLDTIDKVYRYMDRKTKAVQRKSEFITQERKK